MLGGSQQIVHFGFLIDTQRMCILVSDQKIKRVRLMVSRILLRAQRNRRVVSEHYLRKFCGVCVALTLAVPLARFYTRSIFFDISRADKEERRAKRRVQRNVEKMEWCYERSEKYSGTWSTPRAATSSPRVPSSDMKGVWGRIPRKKTNTQVLLNHQSLRDNRYWRSLAMGEGRELQPAPPQFNLHSDAADVGWGGTLGHVLSAGFLCGSRFLDRNRPPPPVYYTLRAAASAPSAFPRALAVHVQSTSTFHPRARRQSGSGGNNQQYGVCEAGHDGRASETAKTAAWFRDQHTSEMDYIRGQQVRRFPLTHIVPGRRAGISPRCRRLVRSVCLRYQFDGPAFTLRTMGEPLQARLRSIKAQLDQDWSHGKAQLWNPPFDFIPLVIGKIQQE